MAQQNPTVYQKLSRLFSNGSSLPTSSTVNGMKNIPSADDILYTTKDRQEYETKLLQKKQNALLQNQWQRSQYDLANTELQGLTQVKLMYRECDMMDLFPEIGTALDIMMEEACTVSEEGTIINITSESSRIESILKDLFFNRLSINVTLPMITRAMCKYGNDFMLLNLTDTNGIIGWKQLPVYEMERYEHGMSNPYTAAFADKTGRDDSTKFVWVAGNNYVPYRNWQIGHFRLLYDSLFLPFGVSVLHKARRHFRMLSMMEDMMLLYRLDRSIERRVFKINVGAIDEEDVPAYIQDIANRFKRTTVVDPSTGQLDVRKNILPVWRKTPIPLMDGRIITIEELAKEFEDGKENQVYSIQDKSLQVVPGKVAWCGKTPTPEHLVKINFGNNTYAVMSPEHELVMTDGSSKKAIDLVNGDKVMPYLTTFDYNEYVYNPHNGKFVSTDTITNDSGFDAEMPSKKTFGCIVTSIETIEPDDVYCMTVLGMNGEHDRHNFAIATFKRDGDYDRHGCFVRNCVQDDFFIPVREDGVASPIETLPAAQNLTAMDDIKFVQKKVLAALKVPRSFLNFDETTGEGKNLSLMDVRFSRSIRRIQQALIMELNKIAIIHLYLLGFEDELTNFNITMNNPSSQAEMLELENLSKKITTAKDAVSDPGGGMPLMSLKHAWKTILKWSDREIEDNLNELRMERALVNELELTPAIIKRTGVFDKVDNIFGEPGAEYPENAEGMEGGDEMGMDGGGGPAIGGGMGDMDFGDEMGDGVEGDMSMDDAMGGDMEGDAMGAPDMGDDMGAGADDSTPMGESYLQNKLDKVIVEKTRLQQELLEKEKHYKEVLNERRKNTTSTLNDIPSMSKTFFINEELNALSNELKDYVDKHSQEDNEQ